MYGLQLEAAHAGLFIELEGLGVSVMAVSVSEGGPLGYGAPRNICENGVLLGVGACSERGSLLRMILAIVSASERLGLSNKDVLPRWYAWWRRETYATQGTVTQLEQT